MGAYRTEYTDGREFLHGVHPFLGHGVVGNGIDQGDGGHEEGDAEAVQDEQGSELHLVPGNHTVNAGSGHEQAGKAVTHGQNLLGFHLFVCHNAHEGGHEDGHDALHGKEPFDLRAQADVPQVAAQGGEIGAPDGKLQEQHRDELDGNGFNLHLHIRMCYYLSDGFQSYKNTNIFRIFAV